MNEEFQDNCPYCLSNDIQYMGKADYNKFFNYNIEEYSCKGNCKKDFFIQSDNKFIMTNTMNNKFLSHNSLAFNSKLFNEKHIFIKFNIDNNLNICANCVSYQFINNQFKSFEDIKGICDFQNYKYNYSLSDNITIGQLKPMNNCDNCDYFFNYRFNINNYSEDKNKSNKNKQNFNFNF